MSEYDKRQINLMKKQIESYRFKEIPLCQLISDLESLASYLQDNYSWKSEFIITWGRLEEIYGCALEYDQGILRDEDNLEVNAILTKLEILLNEYEGKNYLLLILSQDIRVQNLITRKFCTCKKVLLFPKMGSEALDTATMKWIANQLSIIITKKIGPMIRIVIL